MIAPARKYEPDEETIDDLRSMYYMLFDGEFYLNHDESSRLLGVLREHLINTGVNL